MFYEIVFLLKENKLIKLKAASEYNAVVLLGQKCTEENIIDIIKVYEVD